MYPKINLPRFSFCTNYARELAFEALLLLIYHKIAVFVLKGRNVEHFWFECKEEIQLQ